MLTQCTDLGYHQSISKVLQFYLSSRQGMQQNVSSGLQQLNTTVSELNQNQDRDALIQANSSSFCLPLRFQYQAYDGDQVRFFSIVFLIFLNSYLLFLANI